MASKHSSPNGSCSARPATSATCPERWAVCTLRRPRRSIDSLRSTPTTVASVRRATASATPAGPVATSSTRRGCPAAILSTTERRHRRSCPNDNSQASRSYRRGSPVNTSRATWLPSESLVRGVVMKLIQSPGTRIRKSTMPRARLSSGPGSPAKVRRSHRDPHLDVSHRHRERSADDLDPAAEAGRTGQPLVAGDKDDVQQFGKCYVRGVVRRQVLSQFPTACEQLSMRDPLQRQRQEIRHGKVRSSRFELPRHDLSSPYGGDLQVDQFRRGESLATKGRASGVAVRIVVGEGGGQDAGINDDHDPPGGSRSPS